MRNENLSCAHSFALERFGAINLGAPFAGITADGLVIKTDRVTGKVSGECPLTNFKK